MDKMRMESPDLTQRRIDAIGNLFPSCITETVGSDGTIRRAVNFDMLRQILTDDAIAGDEAYEFTWVGKKAAMVEASRPIRMTLRPCVADSHNWDSTQNLYIEGDNLETLKLIQESYLGKIKLIYIDPPYNTGHDFIYRDTFSHSQSIEESQMGMFDEETDNKLFENTVSNGRFHSDWCSMLYSRLLVARNLLSSDGMIVISIGHHEMVNTMQICNEIFGERQVVCVTVQTSGGKPSGGFNFLHEYLIWVVPEEFSAYAVSNWGGKDRSPFEGLTLSTFDKTQRPNQTYPIFVNEDGTFAGVGKSLQELIDSGEYTGEKIDFPYDYSVAPAGTTAVWPVTAKGKQCVWRQIPERIRGDWEKGYIKITPNKSEGSGNKYSIQYLPSGVIKKVEQGELEILGHEDGAPTLVFGKNQTVGGQVPTIWTEKSFFTVNGTQMMKQLFPEAAKIFDYPKPVDLLLDIIQACTTDDDIVLDFFSGSATAAHAVMAVNAMDGKHRRFIMVQLPEALDAKSEPFKLGYRTICDIGRERLRRAGEKVVNEAGLLGEGIDCGFRVLRLDTTNMKEVYYSAGQYNQTMLSGLTSNIKEDRNDLDLLFGCLLEWGLPLTMPYSSEKCSGCTIHTYNGDDVMACFDVNVPEIVIREMASRHPLRVVFRDSSFASSPERINVEEIFKLLSPNTSVKVL